MVNTLPPFVRTSATSRAAALSMYEHAPTQKALVLEAIRAHGPISDQSLAALLGLPENSVRPRRVDLVADGVIEAAGEGRTARGRRCQLWRCVPQQLGLGL